MSQGALISWKEECEAIQTEMDRLLGAGWPETAEERQVRKIQFMALIERRNVSAHNLLQSDGGTARLSIHQQEPLEPPRRLPPNTDPMFQFGTMNVEASEEPSESALAMDRNLQPPPANQVSEVEIMNLRPSQEPSEVARAIDRDHRPQPADPIYEVEIVNVQVSEEPPEPSLAIDRDPPPPSADPRFEVRNFLKFLRLK